MKTDRKQVILVQHAVDAIVDTHQMDIRYNMDVAGALAYGVHQHVVDEIDDRASLAHRLDFVGQRRLRWAQPRELQSRFPNPVAVFRNEFFDYLQEGEELVRTVSKADECRRTQHLCL